MNKIEKIRAEIERQIEEEKNNLTEETELYYGARQQVRSKLLSFLDTLSEEPDKSLEEAACEQAKSFGYMSQDVEFKENVESFIAGINWQKEQDTREMIMSDGSYFQKCYEQGKKDMKEQMLKNAVEGYVNYYEDSGGILIAEAQVGCPYHTGDKVRIIVLKEGEE